MQIRQRPDQETIDTMTGASFYTLRRGLAGSVAVAALLAAIPAAAQISGANSIAAPTPDVGNTNAGTPSAGTQQDVVVTGSRLRTSNLTSEAPVTVVTARQIEQSSAQTVEDVLRKIPAIGSEGNFSTTNNGGNGSSCIDLRNLGITRTLVLVDGRRFIRTGYGTGNDCVDLDTIPVSLIDRVEILKDGASSIYGADAVAGVINIIMKKNFTGTQINLGGNISASGDDREGDISGTTGFDFDQGRGNVAVTGRYLDRGPVLQRNRDWADPVATIDHGPGKPFGYGSGYPVTGRFSSADGTTVNDETVKNGALTPFINNSRGGPGDRYDYGQLQYLSNRETQGNFAGNAHYDINEHITAYVQAYYTHKATRTQLAGQPITGAVNTPQQFDIPQGNPYAEALGVDQELFALRRVSDWGPRDYNTAVDTWQITGGFKGKITGNWDYDAYYTYGHAKTTLNYTNQVNFNRLEQEMGFQGTDPANPDTGIYNPAVCNAAAGCVLANPFGVGSFSKGAINYASFTSNAQAITQLRDLGATVTNNKLVQLPYGPLGLAVGMEHRGEQGAYHPDPVIESGASTANFELPTGGGFSATEVYGELSIPLLKNLFMAKDLSADVSGRWSDYSTFGSVYTWRTGLNWTPVRDIRFRGNIGTATREPAIQEAFGGATGSFNTANDPCAQTASYGASAGIVAANCARKGIQPGFQQSSTQINTLVGGNPALGPENSRTYTVGTVLTPRWVRNFSATVDYFHTSINNSINSTSTQYVLDQCYTSNNLSSPLCADAGNRNGSGQVSGVQALYQNLGVTRTNGIDFDVNYLIHLGGGHTLSFSNELVDTIGYTEQLVNGGPFLNLKGRLSVANTVYASGYPVIKDNLTSTYAKGGFSFSWTVRYIDGMTYNNGALDNTPTSNRFYRTNEVFFHDIEATYNWRKVQFVGGIDNLFDRTPPFVLDGNENTAPNVYGADIFGRLFYAKAQIRF